MSELECNILCPGSNDGIFCGGENAANIHGTGISKSICSRGLSISRQHYGIVFFRVIGLAFRGSNSVGTSFASRLSGERLFNNI